jgi:hypothetical protein
MGTRIPPTLISASNRRGRPARAIRGAAATPVLLTPFALARLLPALFAIRTGRGRRGRTRNVTPAGAHRAATVAPIRGARAAPWCRRHARDLLATVGVGDCRATRTGRTVCPHLYRCGLGRRRVENARIGGWRRRDALPEGRNCIHRCWAPASLVEFVRELQMEERPGAVPDLDSVIDSQTRGERCSKQKAPIRRPFAVRSVRCIDSSYPRDGAPVVNVNFAGKVTKASEEQQTPLRVEQHSIRERRAKVMERAHTLIEEHGFCGHNCNPMRGSQKFMGRGWAAKDKNMTYNRR